MNENIKLHLDIELSPDVYYVVKDNPNLVRLMKIAAQKKLVEIMARELEKAEVALREPIIHTP